LDALLDAAVVALRNHSSVRLPSLPRLADFATWGQAAESSHSEKPAFMNAYLSNRASLNQVAIDTSIVGPPILQILNGEGQWNGLLTELLEALNSTVPESVRKTRAWPSIPRQLKAELNRLAPNLRQFGIEVTFGKRTNQGIPVELRRSSKSSTLSTPSATVQKRSKAKKPSFATSVMC
jgi:hypothetical protein